MRRWVLGIASMDRSGLFGYERTNVLFAEHAHVGYPSTPCCIVCMPALARAANAAPYWVTQEGFILQPWGVISLSDYVGASGALLVLKSV